MRENLGEKKNENFNFLIFKILTKYEENNND
jgi:hypothetical protein